MRKMVRKQQRRKVKKMKIVMWKSIQTNSFYIARKSRDNFMICTMITHSIWCRKCKPCFDNRFIVDLLHVSLFTWIPKLCFDIFAFAKIVDVINERLQYLRESICWHGRIYFKIPLPPQNAFILILKIRKFPLSLSLSRCLEPMQWHAHYECW